LTCSGEAFAARMAGSLLHAVGLAELVTHDMAHYEARALELAGHRVGNRDVPNPTVPMFNWLSPGSSSWGCPLPCAERAKHLYVSASNMLVELDVENQIGIFG
jgi:hypothetical protein